MEYIAINFILPMNVQMDDTDPGTYKPKAAELAPICTFQTSKCLDLCSEVTCP